MADLCISAASCPSTGTVRAVTRLGGRGRKGMKDTLLDQPQRDDFTFRIREISNQVANIELCTRSIRIGGCVVHDVWFHSYKLIPDCDPILRQHLDSTPTIKTVRVVRGEHDLRFITSLSMAEVRWNSGSHKKQGQPRTDQDMPQLPKRYDVMYAHREQSSFII